MAASGVWFRRRRETDSVGVSPSGKAPGFDPGIRRFESYHPSHSLNLAHAVRGRHSGRSGDLCGQFEPPARRACGRSPAQGSRGRSGGPVQRRRGQRGDRGQRPRRRRVPAAVHVRAHQRQPGGAADHGRCRAPFLGVADHRGGAVFRLCPSGSAPALGARGHQCQGGGRHDGDGGHRSPAHRRPARGPDPGLLQDAGGQRLCLAGAGRPHGHPRLPGSGDRVAGHRRRRAGQGASPSRPTTWIWRSSTSGGRAPTRRR